MAAARRPWRISRRDFLQMSAGARRRPGWDQRMVGTRRIGILGGTLDPIHLGHVLTAEQARAAAPIAGG